MRKFKVFAAFIFSGLFLSAGIQHAHAASPVAGCDPIMAAGIPVRAAKALSGSEFAKRIQGLGDDGREAAIQDELMAGNIPQFLRQLVPVRVESTGGQGGATITCVLPDYLAIGSDQDYLLVPMRLETALNVASRYGFVLPTRKLVDAIYAQSRVQLTPQPLPASDAMRSTAYYWHHNEMVHDQRGARGAPLGLLTAGDKKDLVITSRLWSNLERVAIYGWHTGPGRPIQPLSTVHGWHYADYSHGVRLVAANAWVDGQQRSIVDLLSNPNSASLLSDEGAIPRLAELIATLRTRKAEAAAVVGLLH